MKREHAFTDVDAQSDTKVWMRVLDKVRQEPLYAAYKQRTVELLDPQPGSRYLEVGAGTGVDALAFAARFGANVVATDSSIVMMEEARRRGLKDALDPVAALGEMVRVVKPEGQIVVVDPDYDTQVVAVPDQELARRVLRFRSDFGLRNDRLAHQMGRLFVQAGLADVQVEAVPILLRDPTVLDTALGLRDWAAFAHEQGLIEADEVPAWEAALDEAAANGTFLYSLSLFITAGRKPPRTP